MEGVMDSTHRLHNTSKKMKLHDDFTPLVGSQESREKLTSRSYKWRSVVLPFLFPALGGLLYGYDTGATSCAILSLESSSVSGTDWYDLSSVEIGLVESGSLYGALVGSIVAFTVADFLGRRRELLTASVFYMLGALLTAAAPNFIVFVIGRLVYGFGMGMAMHGAPMYIAETSPSEIRGTLISMKETLVVTGILLGYLIGYLAIDTVGGWRVMYGVGVSFALIMAIGVGWLPPSPRWIILRGYKGGENNMELARERAAVAIRRLRGKDVDDNIVENLLEETLQSLQLGENEVGLSDIFRGTSLKALTIGVGLVIFQQITGQPSVLYYAATIFQI